MTTIRLTTLIKASAELCFDLSRDVAIHELSTQETKERAVSGRTSGLFELDDEVTWEAVHFGIRQRLKVKITKFDRPVFFEDTMQKGAFKSMRHEHYFKEMVGMTTMEDVFFYEVPFGIFGRIFDKVILCRYMTNFLKKRNALIKDIAENRPLPDGSN